ncbi:MAG: hypothetical protein LBP39_01860 [Rickettsiales bacterium]|jgi:hypothetical protein|nr:hypothetical protein [Rickettsiales bacterium]
MFDFQSKHGVEDGPYSMRFNRMHEERMEKQTTEKLREFSEEDIKVLKQEGLLPENFNLPENFRVDKGRLPSEFVKKMTDITREKYSDLAAELPISYVACRKMYFGKMMDQIPTEDTVGLTILDGKYYSRLLVRRLLPDGKIEIYVIDSHSNDEIEVIKDAYGDSSKFIVKYPETEKSIEDKKQIESPEEKIEEFKKEGKSTSELEAKRGKCSMCGIKLQMDDTHCISHAIHFASRIYEAVKNEIDKGNAKNAVEGFNRVMDGFKEHIRIDNISPWKLIDNKWERIKVKKERRMFLFPDFLLKSIKGETVLDMVIEAREKEKKYELDKKIKEHEKMMEEEKRREEKINNRKNSCGKCNRNRSRNPVKKWRDKVLKKISDKFRKR